jgi:hypothetical protein
MQASSETIAGDGVADREREEDERDGDHGDIQHEMILSTPTAIASKLLFRGHEIEPNDACESGFPLRPR